MLTIVKVENKNIPLDLQRIKTVRYIEKDVPVERVCPCGKDHHVADPIMRNARMVRIVYSEDEYIDIEADYKDFMAYLFVKGLFGSNDDNMNVELEIAEYNRGGKSVR